MQRISILILLLFAKLVMISQIKNVGTIPIINYYSADDYNASIQNQAIAQDNRGIMYFGNADGSLLEFDGQNWNRYKVADNAIFSLCVDKNNNIFVGGKSSFGYMHPTANGGYKYTSLKHLFPDDYKDFRRVWDIFITEDSNIFFHTFDEIFIYDYNTIKVYPIDEYYAKGLFNMAYKVNDEIYTYVKWKGIYQVVNNDLKFVKGTEIVDSSFVRAILPYKHNKKIIFTWTDGAFELSQDTIKHIDTPIDDLIIGNTFKVVEIKENYFGFLLRSGGFLITDKNFNIIQILKSPNNVVNDIFSTAFTDKQNNLWLCSNNGINSVYLFSPFSEFRTDYGFDNEATCTAALKYNNKLLIGTSTNVFVKKWNNFEDKKNLLKFDTIFNKNGFFQTKQICNINNDILIATDGGLLQLKNNKLIQILEARSISAIQPALKDSNTVIGIKGAIFIFKKSEADSNNLISNEWTFVKDIQGYEGSFLEQDQDGNFWISDLVNGVVKLTFNDDYTTITNSVRYSENDATLNGLPTNSNIRIFKIQDKVVFTTNKGLYFYNKATDTFEPLTEINSYLNEKDIINHVFEDDKSNIWIKKGVEKNNITSWQLMLLKKQDTGYVVIEKPFLFLKNKIFSFFQISSNEYIIGSQSGFIHYDTNIEFDIEESFPVFIRSVKITNNDSIIFAGNFITEDSLISNEQKASSIPVIMHKYANLRFTFAGAYYKLPNNMEYKYFLEGNDENWSDWTKENYKDFSNLKHGEYTFYVKARNFYGVESPTVSYKFIIKPPFYRTIVAYITYFIITGLLIWLIVYLYTRRLRKQKEYLEYQVQLRTKEIAQQNIEIQAQRDELANKNEKIQKINKDLTDSIEYAKRIQTAMLPLAENINKHLPENFILFKPRDIVSGDFYWFAEKNGKIFITAVDCTGHGVPGAFMSMIGAEILTTIVSNKEVDDAAKILELLNQYVRNALKQDTTENQDGMDMALCVIDKENKTLEFSGAKNPLMLIHNNKLEKIRGSKQSIGGFQFGEFEKTTVKYESPTWFYIFSDGYPDQFGGPENSKFMIKYFKEILVENHKKTMQEQKDILNYRIMDWMKETRQTDDILVIGFKL